MSDNYLIWSHEHGQWWKAGKAGYAHDLDDAGRYSREHAMDICKKAIFSARGVPSEIPVREADMLEIQRMIRDIFGDPKIGGM